jgi:Ca2+-binding RTX toxin-like protein
MTTFTVTASRLSFDANGDPSSVAPVTLEFVVPDGGSGLSYVIDSVTPGELPLVTFTASFQNVRIDGDLVDPFAFDAGFGFITWVDNGTPRRSLVLEMADTATDTSVLLALGGDALPEFASLAEAQAFSGSVTGIGPIGGGPYRPGNTFSLFGVPGVVSSQDDTIIGASGDDSFDGGIGADTISGLGGNDTLLGGTGEDVLAGGGGRDLLNGGGQNDMLSGGAARDRLLGGKGNDDLSGDAGNDLLRGQVGSDMLSGGNGKDRLQGGAGRDVLDGGNQTDILEGQGGNDTLTGGGGADTFRFGPGGGTDRVLDFADDVDTLAFDAALWGGGLSAAEVLDQFARDRGGNVVFDFADGTRVVVENASVADLADDLSLF